MLRLRREMVSMSPDTMSCAKNVVSYSSKTPRFGRKMSFRSHSKPNIWTHEGKRWTVRPTADSQPCFDTRNS
jgi:hypothetical protein